jgi:hypothetical protein
MLDPFWTTMQQMIAPGSRSTVLKALGWLIALTLFGAISAFRLSSPIWFAGTLGVLALVSVVLYMVAYVYFAITDKDALRSERFSIQKMAIGKGFFGDDISGYTRIERKPILVEQVDAVDAVTEEKSAEGE